MESISFFFKSLLIAFVAVLVMQVQVGSSTLEDHVLAFARTSTVTQPVQLVADGATKAIRNGWNYISRWVNNHRPAAGERAASFFNMERSPEYTKTKEKKPLESEQTSD
jgi:hypothetical protein